MKEVSFKNRDRLVNLGLAISNCRKLAGISQEELAEKSGVSRSTISEIEASGKIRNFSIDCLYSIADVLQISASDLLRRAEVLDKNF